MEKSHREKSHREKRHLNWNKKRKSLGIKLLLSFLVTSMIPILVINLFSYYNIFKIVTENHKDFVKYHLSHTKAALGTSLESYGDVLYQIYSDDNVIYLINRINNDEELVVSKNQLRRTLRGYFYVKDYIKDISILTEGGTLVFYDSITGSTTRSSWLPESLDAQRELYEACASKKDISILPTERAGYSGNGENYLFHMCHRIVDFKRQNKTIGVVLLSIDEKMLEGICMGGGEGMDAYCFLADQDGVLLSFPQKERLGTSVWRTDEEKNQAYRKLAEQQDMFHGESVSVDYIQDSERGWDIVNVSSQSKVLGEINEQQKLTIGFVLSSMLLLVVVMACMIQGMTKSVKSVVRIMQSAGKGQLQKRVEVDAKMPSEIEVIANQYNIMMDRLVALVEKEKELDQEKKDAEIAALEAQLNPHFLYNTLDTINWIAIGRKEFEISRAITSLASILRYGIDNSNGMVTVQEEYDWLKQYLMLQQIRLKDGFESTIHIPLELMPYQIHKLLFQPFVENSFIHGFKGIPRKPKLKIQMERVEKGLWIAIKDNGRGMPKEVTQLLNLGKFQELGNKGQLGLKNACYRIQLYYEGRAIIQAESEEGAYTSISIMLPLYVNQRLEDSLEWTGKKDYESRSGRR